ncbi:uncharacterized protein LOC129596863 [Paramacrobiotus metropolitanus]|uniref:uncharacterized protein LOC129596863 n=1 Tax=Paramacrobiotus metropolitanus TaxID=2943436 RepID=UPI0024456DD1|nr:uncharacterized protein LOC129596863 [Paramacrobiotus metropolitanus]
MMSEAHTNGTFQHDFSETIFRDLPHAITACILGFLDIITQPRISGVCALWKLLCADCGVDRHIIFDMRSQDAPKPGHRKGATEWAYLTYHFISMLDRIITPLTRTLAFVSGERNISMVSMWPIRRILQFKRIRVPSIIGQNSRYSAHPEAWTFRDSCLNSLNDTSNYSMLSDSGLVCEQLILRNYTSQYYGTNILMGWFSRHANRSTWPQQEDRFRRRSNKFRRFAVLPCLRIRSTDTAAEQGRCYLAAVNDQCPAVSLRVREKIAAVLARWVRTLAYPDDWADIRVFLNVFSSFYPDDSPQRWDVDLRELDVTMLSNLAAHLLDSHYNG